jgi:hypothetical protein
MTDRCPRCNKVFKYNSCSDSYVVAECTTKKFGKDRTVTLFLCPAPCGGTIAISLEDGDGTLYVPCTKSL